jgi:hypothetical protein
MRRLSLVLFVLALTTLGVPRQPASADVLGDDPLNRELPSDPCPTYDSCTMYVWNDSALTFDAATCKQSGCRACDSINRCRTVMFDARCTCDDIPVAGAGPNITNCGNYNGSCIAR